MKLSTFLTTFTTLTLLIVVMACQKEIQEPVACFEVSAETVKPGEEMIFTSCSKADHISIWTGDNGRDYTKQEVTGETQYVARDVGVRVADESYVYAYKEAGEYTVYWIATNVGNDGRDVKSAVAQRVIKVVE